ncbi:LLM class F420-dependent oxidoreductase [Mycolicibacillus trivialis]|uniref:LLM class F420-dependent oxidoreductase n=1 Tax=Mycolicibacillus trivialis TaxID=1798 RepID=A0A1X2EHE5_9MYCO|nr:LLM class F420-dependent oxidoreductase [Mycolicibacillus trivialis]ORX02132.1 LLM class F420-dependent oxidoreductase [Mycolicibacillus trivialis]
MTDAIALKPELGRYGVWTFGRVTPDEAVEIERLGYGALWVGGSPAADLEFVEPILAATETLQVATGIVNIWTAPAAEVAASFQRIEAAHPSRFLLGIGAGHREHTEEYTSPVQALEDYLEALDVAGVPTSRRVVAALGPRVLELAAQHSAGAHPYLTIPEHTGGARELIGNTVFLAPEHKVVLTTDAEAARGVGRKALDLYLGLSNYVKNWHRMGFGSADVSKPGSDRFVDAMVAHGTAAQIAARLEEHLDAGADHVAIQVLGGRDQLLPTLTELAEPLGLTARD